MWFCSEGGNLEDFWPMFRRNFIDKLQTLKKDSFIPLAVLELASPCPQFMEILFFDYHKYKPGTDP